MPDNPIARQKIPQQNKIADYVLGFVNNSLYGIAPIISTLGSAALLSLLISKTTTAIAFGLGAFCFTTSYSIFKNKEVEIKILKKITKAEQLFEKILAKKKDLIPRINKLDKSSRTQQINKLLAVTKQDKILQDILPILSSTKWLFNKMLDSYMLGLPAVILITISGALSFSKIANNQIIAALSILSSNIIQGFGLHIYVARKLHKIDNNIEMSLSILEKELKNIAAINIELKNANIRKLIKKINGYPNGLQVGKGPFPHTNYKQELLNLIANITDEPQSSNSFHRGRNLYISRS